MHKVRQFTSTTTSISACSNAQQLSGSDFENKSFKSYSSYQ